MKCILPIGLLYLCCAQAVGAAAKKPNLPVILGDAIGFSDLGCYGGEIIAGPVVMTN